MKVQGCMMQTSDRFGDMFGSGEGTSNTVSSNQCVRSPCRNQNIKKYAGKDFLSHFSYSMMSPNCD